MDHTALLDAIIQNAIDGMIIMDDHGLIVSVNPAACALFGYEAAEVTGRTIAWLMPDAVSMSLGRVNEVSGRHKDGSLFPLRLVQNEVAYKGRTVYTAFIHDLSREKKAETELKEYTAQLEQLVEARTRSLQETVLALQAAKKKVNLSLKKEKHLGQLKSRFVSLASHEFRTPLSTVQLSASLIEKYAAAFSSPNISKHVSKIKNAVSGLTVMLDDLLSLEKLEAGKQEPVFASFDLVEFAEDITEDMQVLAKVHQAIIYQHTGLTSKVNLDQQLLRTCIVNLISNAIKYSGENTFIDFTTEISPSACTVTVRDNGIGIPAADQPHLFEAFFRAHNTGTIPGTGLGLNIVALNARLMKGTIEFKSRMNEGALFTVIFPLHD